MSISTECKVMRYLGLLAAWLWFSLGYTPALAVGLMPVPVLKDVQMRAQTSFDTATGRYTYAYTVSNPASNTGQIWDLSIDVGHSGDVSWMDASNLPLPRGAFPTTFEEDVAESRSLISSLGLSPPVTGVLPVPVGLQVPSGWLGNVAGKFASFSSSGPSVRIWPGQTRSGYTLISPGLPTIRAAVIDPKWVLVVPDVEDVSEEEEAAAAAVEEQIRFHTVTLGPSGVYPGTYEHWNQLRDDLNKAVQLGWVPDQAFAATLINQLASARQAADAGDGTLAKQRLQTLLATLAQSTSSERRQEARDLVYWNTQALIASTPPSPSNPR